MQRRSFADATPRPALAFAFAAALLVACGSSEADGPASSAAPAPATSAPPASSGGEPPSSTDETPVPPPAEAGLGGERPSEELPLTPPGEPAPPAEPEAPEEAEEPETPSVDPASLPPLAVWIAGDSTVANGQTPCPRGWGGAIGALFDERVTVNNRARGGRSVNTWLYDVLGTMDATGECELRRDASGAPALQPDWQQVLDGIQPGDYLLIQFGINDGDRNCNRHVGIDAFQASYRMMAEAARARGANPLFLTPVSMVRCNGTTAVGSRGEYVPATLQLGATLDVPVIDLHALSVELYQSLAFCPIPGGDVSAATAGPVGDFFCDDHTHFDRPGAERIAELVARALRDQRLPLAAYLREPGN